MTPIAHGRSRSRATLAWTLWSRVLLFLLVQALIALGFVLAGSADPWDASAAWWLVVATVGSAGTLALLVVLLRGEGSSFRAMLHAPDRRHARDIGMTLALFLVGGALAMAGNLGLAWLVWDDPATGGAMLLRPIPTPVGAAILVLFPVMVALTELPLYYGYVMPRLIRAGSRPLVAIALVAAVHSLQHAALPLLFDARFFAWRALMFLPFTLFLAAVLHRWPRLLPYFMVGHALLDTTAAWQVYAAP